MSLEQQEQLRVFPIDTPAPENGVTPDHQLGYYNVPGRDFAGPSERERIQLTLESGLDDEVTQSLNTLIGISYQKPQVLSLKGEYMFLVDYLTYYLDCKVFNPAAENDDLDKSLDAALILRNLVQDIYNSQVISLNAQIKEILLNVLQFPTIVRGDFSDPHYGQCKEMLRYAMDIIEVISSYFAPAPADSDLFIALTKLFMVVDDRSTVTTILRSMSRLMYNSAKTGDCPDNIKDEILDRAVSYLEISVSEQTDNDELILTTLDFLCQFAQHGRTDRLLSSYQRACILQSFLPKLLTYKLDYKTEFTQPMKPLTLIRRVREPIPDEPPFLTEAVTKALNALPEPERATSWLRCSFEPGPDGQVTQISLWRAYEKQFSPFVASEGLKLLPAVDFIKNVNHAFPNSAAMVINEPGENKKFVIKGIQPRVKCVDVATGKKDALEATAPVAAAFVNAERSEQAPANIFKYSYNDYLKLNEINTSSAVLMRQLVQYPSGSELFKGQSARLVDMLMYVPNLLPDLYEILTKLEY